MFEFDIEKPPQLSEMVYNQLREAIVTRNIQPGTTLVQEQLAEQLNMSRTPVRDALDRLIRDGFARRTSGGRVVIAELSLKELREKYEVRQALEGLAVQLAATRISQDQIDQIQEIIECTRNSNESREELLACGVGFHDVIIEASQNNFLIQTLRDINDTVRHYRALEVDIPGRYKASMNQHEDIFEMLMKGDGETASLLMQKHIKELADQLITTGILSDKNNIELE